MDWIVLPIRGESSLSVKDNKAGRSLYLTTRNGVVQAPTGTFDVLSYWAVGSGKRGVPWMVSTRFPSRKATSHRKSQCQAAARYRASVYGLDSHKSGGPGTGEHGFQVGWANRRSLRPPLGRASGLQSPQPIRSSPVAGIFSVWLRRNLQFYGTGAVSGERSRHRSASAEEGDFRHQNQRHRLVQVTYSEPGCNMLLR